MDSYDAEQAAELKRKRTFRKFSYRGYELDSLLDMSTEDFMKIVHARARRRFSRGLKRKPMGLIKKLRKAKKEAPANEKPAVVKTHLRDMLVVPEMCGSQIGIYSGRVFNTVEIRPEMIGHYLGMYFTQTLDSVLSSLLTSSPCHLSFQASSPCLTDPPATDDLVPERASCHSSKAESRFSFHDLHVYFLRTQ